MTPRVTLFVCVVVENWSLHGCRAGSFRNYFFFFCLRDDGCIECASSESVVNSEMKINPSIHLSIHQYLASVRKHHQGVLGDGACCLSECW